MWNELQGKLSNITDIVPLARFGSANRPLNLPWCNSRLKRLNRDKDVAWREFDNNPTLDNFRYASVKDNLFNKEEIKLKSNYERKLTNNLKYNSKGFYSYLRNKKKLKSGGGGTHHSVRRQVSP